MIAVFTGCALTGTKRDRPVAFSRIYKTGEKVAYAVESKSAALGPGSTTMEMTVTTQKLADSGRAALLFHWSNLHLPPDFSGQLPADVTLTTSDNNLAGHFQPTMGSLDFLAAVLQLASVTADKPVNVGDVTAFNWGGQALGLKGTVKLLEVTPEKHQMKAEIQAKMVIQGNAVADMNFKSTYDLSTCRMISSTGTMGALEEFKVMAHPQ